MRQALPRPTGYFARGGIVRLAHPPRCPRARLIRRCSLPSDQRTACPSSAAAPHLSLRLADRFRWPSLPLSMVPGNDAVVRSRFTDRIPLTQRSLMSNRGRGSEFPGRVRSRVSSIILHHASKSETVPSLVLRTTGVVSASPTNSRRPDPPPSAGAMAGLLPSRQLTPEDRSLLRTPQRTITTPLWRRTPRCSREPASRRSTACGVTGCGASSPPPPPSKQTHHY